MRHRLQPLIPLSAAAEFLFPTTDNEHLSANSLPSVFAPPAAQSQGFPSSPSPNIALQASAGQSRPYSRPFSVAMFHLGSRSKSPRAVIYCGIQGGDESNTEISNQPTSKAMESHDPPRFQKQITPDCYSSDSSLVAKGRRHRSSGVFHKSPLSPTTSVRTTTTTLSRASETYSMARSTRGSQRSFLGRGRKHSPVNEEFDPTTFRKNRSRPALGALGQDAVYQKYDDLFEEGDEDDSYADGEASQTEASGDENGFFLLQIDGTTGEVKYRTKDISPISPNKQRPDSLNLALVKNPSFSSTESITTASPSPRPLQTPQRSWPNHMTTPPRGTTPSVEESVDPRLPITAPPTPPPKFAPLTVNTTVNNWPIDLVEHSSDLSSRSASAPVAARVDGRRFGDRISSMGALTTVGRARSAEGLSIVNIPSPTLVVWTTKNSAEHTEGHVLPAPPKNPALTLATSKPYKATMQHGEVEGTSSEQGEDTAPMPPPKLRPRTSSRLGHPNAIDALTTRLRSIESKGNRSDASVDEFLDNTPTQYPPGTEPKTQESHFRTDFEPGSVAEANDAPTPIGQTPHKQRRSSVVQMIYDSSSEREDMVEGRPKADLAYLRAFRAFVKASANNDAFVSRNPRFDAIQAHRICSHLRDGFPLQANPTPKARRPSNTTVRPAIDSKARLREAGEEIMTSLWALMAGRWLSFGKMVISPAHEQLMAACVKPRARRGTVASQMLAKTHEGSVSPERRRILDLGGIPVADWGWHCAVDYPKVKVYTVTQRPAKPPGDSPTSRSSPDRPTPIFRGPKNHRYLTVERLYRLPFPDNHFDIVSARTLFLILKSAAPSRTSQQVLDEYDQCMEECMRVLKPGGYFEYIVFDSDVVNAGPLASKLFARFSAALEASGRDPEPTKRWITRLNDAGFTDIMRAWTFLPLAPPVSKPKVPSKDEDDLMVSPQAIHGVDAIEEQVRRKIHAWESTTIEPAGGVKGTTKNVAAVCGLLGGWVWGKWLRSAGIVEEETVGDVIEEAKELGSGLRTLTGYARKPL